MKKEESLIRFALLLNVVYFCIFWVVHQLFSTALNIQNIIIGNVMLWIILIVTIGLMTLFCKISKFTVQDNIPLFTNILIVVILLLSSSFFIAWHTHHSVEHLTLWKQLFLHVFGFLYAYFMFAVVTGFYTGNIFKIIGLAVSVIFYLIFAIFPRLTESLAGFLTGFL
jgi:hypothetical protein